MGLIEKKKPSCQCLDQSVLVESLVIFLTVLAAISITGWNLVTFDIIAVAPTDVNSNYGSPRGNLSSLNGSSSIYDDNLSSSNGSSSIDHITLSTQSVSSIIDNGNLPSPTVKSTTGDNNQSSSNATSTTGNDNQSSSNATSTTNDDNQSSSNATSTTGDDNQSSSDATSMTGDDNQSSSNATSMTGDDNQSSSNATSMTGDDNQSSSNATSLTGDDNQSSSDATSMTGDDNQSSSNATSMTGDDNQSSSNATSMTGDDNQSSSDATSTTGDDNQSSSDVTSTTGDDNQSSSNVTSTTGDNNQSSLNVTSTTGDDNQSSSNVTSTTGDDNQSSSDVTSTTGDDNQSSSNVTSTTGDDNQSSSNVTSTTGDDNQSSSNVTSTTGDDNQSSSNATSTTGDDNQSSWNVTSTTGDDNQSSWNVTSTTGDDNQSSSDVTSTTGDDNQSSSDATSTTYDGNQSSSNATSTTGDDNLSSAISAATTHGDNMSLTGTEAEGDYVEVDDDLQDLLQRLFLYFNIGITAVFVIEVLLKLVTLRKSFCTKPSQMLDGVVVIICAAFQAVFQFISIPDIYYSCSYLIVVRLWRIYSVCTIREKRMKILMEKDIEHRITDHLKSRQRCIILENISLQQENQIKELQEENTRFSKYQTQIDVNGLPTRMPDNQLSPTDIQNNNGTNIVRRGSGELNGLYAKASPNKPRWRRSSTNEYLERRLSSHTELDSLVQPDSMSNLLPFSREDNKESGYLSPPVDYNNDSMDETDPKPGDASSGGSDASSTKETNHRKSRFRRQNSCPECMFTQRMTITKHESMLIDDNDTVDYGQDNTGFVPGDGIQMSIFAVHNETMTYRSQNGIPTTDL